MRSFKKWFRKRYTSDDAGDVTALAKTVGPIVDRAANDIFSSYFKVLSVKPVNYLVSAVWGGDGYGQLDTAANGINRMVVPALDDALAVLGLEKLTASQKFAVTYLIRGLIISKIAFMVESAKNITNEINTPRGDHPAYDLQYIEPLGSA